MIRVFASAFASAAVLAFGALPSFASVMPDVSDDLTIETVFVDGVSPMIGRGYDSVRGRVLRSRCVDGVVGLPNVIDRPVWTYGYSASNFQRGAPAPWAFEQVTATYPDLAAFAAPVPADGSTFVWRAELVIDGAPYFHRGDELRRTGASRCGDRFVDGVLLGAWVGVAWHLEFTDAADALSFERSFQVDRSRPFAADADTQARMSEFLSGRAQMKVVVTQGGGSRDGVERILRESRCTTRDLAECDRLFVALREHLDGFAEAQKRDAAELPVGVMAPADFSVPAGWVVKVRILSDYDIIL